MVMKTPPTLLTGATTITGALSESSTAAVAGAATITGAATLSSTLAVAGATTLTGAVTHSSTTDMTAGLVKFATGVVTAAGSSRTDAATLTASYNQVSSTASSTGVLLPASAVGQHVYVQNDGANALKVYAPGSDSIDGTAGSSGVTLTNAKRAMFFCVATNKYVSAQLSTPSA